MHENLKSEAVKSWQAANFIHIEGVGFLQPGKAMFLFDNEYGNIQKYANIIAPKTQSDLEGMVLDAVMRFERPYAILMSLQDFKAYNDRCVAKETVKLSV